MSLLLLAGYPCSATDSKKDVHKSRYPAFNYITIHKKLSLIADSQPFDTGAFDTGLFIKEVENRLCMCEYVHLKALKKPLISRTFL